MSACLQLRRAGAVAITKAIVDKTSLESLELDDNEISEAAVDDIKVCPAVQPVPYMHVGRSTHTQNADALA